jgi:hypothetical protein
MIRTAQPTRWARNRADAESQRPTQPERELMSAVLTTAIDHLLDRRSSPEAEAHRQTARAWIEGGPALVTFADCCAALDMDAAAVPTPTPRARRRLSRRDVGTLADRRIAKTRDDALGSD